MFHYNWQGSTGGYQNNQGSHIYEWMTLPLTGPWGNTTCPTNGRKCYRTPLSCNSCNTSAPPLNPTMGTSPVHIPYPPGGHNKFFIGKYVSPFPLISPLHPQTPWTPLTQNYIPSGTILVNTHFTFVSSTFSHRPEKWLQHGSQESFLWINTGYTLFQHTWRYFNMDTNRVRNLHYHLFYVINTIHFDVDA